MQRLTSYFIIFIFQLNILFAINKKDVLKDLQTKFQNIDNIYFEFHLKNDNSNIGTINAKKGNHYKIVFNNRVIICNGDILWNYSVNDNKVLISNFKQLENVSIESFFFEELKNCSPVSLKSLNIAEKDKKYELKLKNNKTNFEYILYLNNSYDIVSIIIGNDELEWYINNLEINKSSNEKYEFRTSDKMEIIDLR